MKTQVRQSVFETNSSSTHAIAVNTRDKSLLTDIPPLDKHGNFYYTANEGFGWGVEEHYDFYTKLDWCVQQAGDDYSKNNMLVSIIKEYTGAENVLLTVGDYGYIDHDSRGEFPGLFDYGNRDALAAFLFCSDNVLHISNDNGGTNDWWVWNEEKKDFDATLGYENVLTSVSHGDIV